MKKIVARIYRFNNKIALSSAGKTTYLSPTEATLVSIALRDACRDIEGCPDFGGSEFTTIEVVAHDQRSTH